VGFGCPVDKSRRSLDSLRGLGFVWFIRVPSNDCSVHVFANGRYRSRWVQIFDLLWVAAQDYQQTSKSLGISTAPKAESHHQASADKP
jgi:hypothetical protein